jgi:peptide deformylase
MQLRVTQFGEKVLRQQGERVTQFDDELRILAESMVETMYAEEGVGLAAQQVDRALMMCVVDVAHLPADELDYQLDGLRPPIELIMPLVLVNPVIQRASDEGLLGEEGCLSFPSIRGEVPRAESIQVTYDDLQGQSHELICSGWFARVVQHEVDHLNGILFIDRMEKAALRRIEGKVRRLKKETLSKQPSS